MEKRFSQKITQDSENFSCDGYASTSLFGRSPGYVQNPIIRIPRAALNSFNLTGCGGKKRWRLWMEGSKEGGRGGCEDCFLLRGWNMSSFSWVTHVRERDVAWYHRHFLNVRKIAHGVIIINDFSDKGKKFHWDWNFLYSSRDLKHNLCWNRSYEVAFIMAIEHIKSRQVTRWREQPILCGCSPRFSHD